MSTEGITCQNTITYGPETLKKYGPETLKKLAASSATCGQCATYRDCSRLVGMPPDDDICEHFTNTTRPQSAQRVLSMSDDERKAIEMALRMLATQLKRCTVTGMYYLPISAGFACNAEQARAIESALEKIAQY